MKVWIVVAILAVGLLLASLCGAYVYRASRSTERSFTMKGYVTRGLAVADRSYAAYYPPLLSGPPAFQRPRAPDQVESAFSGSSPGSDASAPRPLALYAIHPSAWKVDPRKFASGLVGAAMSRREHRRSPRTSTTRGRLRVSW